MSAERASWSPVARSGWKKPVGIVAGYWLLVVAALANAGEMGAGTGTPADLRHALEDTRFVGQWTYEWDAEPVEGMFIFEDGRFVSRGCLEWGYAPAPYFVRRDEKGIHFYARLPNPEHGTMEFRGLFDGETLRAEVHWSKERWYWTLEQDYRFTGEPVAAGHGE